MRRLTIREIIQATGGCSGNNCEELITGVSTDSRTVNIGDLFVPLTGPNFDGHDFIKQALERGAVVSLCDQNKKAKVDSVLRKNVIFVKNTHSALLKLSAYYRQLFDIPFIAITGSVGKTTTKEMISEILSSRFKVLKTSGNLNNEIGLPLTIFCLEQCYQIGVVELGMSGLGEINRLVNVAKPKIAVITNIGITHIEKLGSKQNIAQAKMEILQPLGKDDLVILNGDSPELWNAKDSIIPRTVFFGQERGDVRARNIKSYGTAGLEFDIYGCYGEMTFRVSLPGIHNVNNALAAIAVGFEMGLTKKEIESGLLNLKSSEMRLQFKKSYFGSDIIDDTYNASPDSMKAALDFLTQISQGKKRAVILGDMLELGDLSERAHCDIGMYAAKRAEVLVAVGNFAQSFKAGALQGSIDKKCIYTYLTVQEAAEEIEKIVRDCDIVLIKASRGMKMEQITKVLVGRQ
ncbi:MAG: UDP-N-acetylmuramoyl-tripeptide--D-alanyl-D-alanine ligase [Tepidanaerobacteraceae bacterium]|nr:UDP-N-acetylmuramoyl-tripeptide--D-alanyl-D-alanine ligase [Tepidanaerobacteraceae bacterium]